MVPWRNIFLIPNLKFQIFCWKMLDDHLWSRKERCFWIFAFPSFFYKCWLMNCCAAGFFLLIHILDLLYFLLLLRNACWSFVAPQGKKAILDVEPQALKILRSAEWVSEKNVAKNNNHYWGKGGIFFSWKVFCPKNFLLKKF